ncbi:MAG: GTPase HflX [Acidimicrobiaceae bacterium]|nr:GTPase HflX [Acidimicrobiaceae bacterium]
MTLIDRSFKEKIILVGVAFSSSQLGEVEDSLDELALLVDTAGAEVVDRVIQRRTEPDPATYVGKGKAEELHSLSETLDVDTVVFDDELSPAQQRNLEKILGRTAIDRTAVILDIFAQNASSMEGKTQVELALLTYRLPRLRGRGKSLSQQVGRIGTRGPGETKLEEDRRRLLARISKLKADLKELSNTRKVQRKARIKSRVASVSLVGYTNSGKSTLLNSLTDADAFVANKLFATLDPRTRRLDLPGGEAILCSDTVGFVKKLPHQLVEAFRSTLEVVAESDLLCHVVDASGTDIEGRIQAVHTVLGEIDAGKVDEILVFNKIDLIDESDLAALKMKYPDSVYVSALERRGLDDILENIASGLRAMAGVVELLVPYDRGDVVAKLHREGEVIFQRESEDGFRLKARLEGASLALFREYQVSPNL